MTKGATFHRGDLHIHSFGEKGSYDVIDTDMTPEKILAKAIEKNLSIISITDHNQIANSVLALKLSEKLNVLVIPGIEVSTSQGHLLAYFPNERSLEDFYGKLTFDAERKFCSQTIYDCMEQVDKYGGFGILAHIEVSSGFEKSIPKFNQIFDRAFEHKAILGLEITDQNSVNHYTEFDDCHERRNATLRRNSTLGLPPNHKLAKIMSSDAHSMNAFGKNASGAERLTRFKMDEMSFDSLRIALQIHDSRVRLEDEVPETLPRFKKIRAWGGILDGVTLDLSNNMNCIIGGRGTGKSTLLLALQEASNNEITSPIKRSSAWPSKIELQYEDDTGREFDFILEHGTLKCFREGQEQDLFRVPVESYSQGFTNFANDLDIDQKDTKLLGFLDGFLDIKYLQSEDGSKITQLETNFDALQRLTAEISQRPAVEKELRELVHKQEAHEQQNVGALMKIHGSLVEEEALRNDIESSLAALKSEYQKLLSNKDKIEHIINTDPRNVRIGSEHLKNVIDIVSEFSVTVDHFQNQLNIALEEKLSRLRQEITEWRAKEKTARQKIEVEKARLDQLKIPYDEGKYISLVSDITRLKRQATEIEKSEKELICVKKERTDLYRSRVDLKRRIGSKRLAFCTRIKRDLSKSVDGMHVDAKIGQGYISSEFSALLKQVMNWHRWEKSKKISDNISPLDFYQKMKRKQYDFLDGLGFNQSEIEDIGSRMSGLDLEKVLSLSFEERPQLTVTRYDAKSDTLDIKDISELSLGQQQSVMLSILIKSDSCLPLIVDQPEDNLDSEFIFNSVVTNLRRCKENRQIIIVTHNSNIGVLGDAELVIPLIASNDRSSVVAEGSIDNKETQDKCCEILEGGRRAFETRKNIYGI
ncbi:hypothetical protein IDSA_11465 [Pseudidiomarina salinarum]|uniref:Polymerase/histidinol phosphatase N-terminal domain-containing protein n=1 Tax=Pseudidiomarina salinarum TaxID=435908 RepID=A0A094L622_9GAMM|nr:PHP domain-containing protein [Pseudidiomarina salinarum]KFZ30173.1 hypothetical protein IDSA_11465 [Pseudidiomarina salinarum]RUO68675.1 PHP domain-containing protein [Pseudidiomarina salinarum]